MSVKTKSIEFVFINIVCVEGHTHVVFYFEDTLQVHVIEDIVSIDRAKEIVALNIYNTYNDYYYAMEFGQEVVEEFEVRLQSFTSECLHTRMEHSSGFAGEGVSFCKDCSYVSDFPSHEELVSIVI